jgi:hypothetical protein
MLAKAAAPSLNQKQSTLALLAFDRSAIRQDWMRECRTMLLVLFL